MYSETESICKYIYLFTFILVNGKKKEKFRQRAVALRRVSIVLCIQGLIMRK